MSIFKIDKLPIKSRTALFCCLCLFFASCECPTEIDTPRQNNSSSFAKINIFNDSGMDFSSYSNNVFIEDLENGYNNLTSYFSGRTIISFGDNDKKIYSQMIETQENSNYTAYVFSNKDRINFIHSEDEVESRLRIFNASGETLTVLINNKSQEISRNSYLIYNELPDFLNVRFGEIDRRVVLSGLPADRINNIAIDSSFNSKYF